MIQTKDMKEREAVRRLSFLKSRRFWAAVFLAGLFLFGIHAIFSFSRMEASASNGLSKSVTAMIQEITDRHFHINPEDSFWQGDLNNIVRKAGHVAEYFLLGLVFCCFLNVVTGRNLPAVLASPVVCFLVAVLDEGFQVFAAGRGPRMADVWLDTAAATAGTLLMGVACGLFWKFQRMSKRLHEYEKRAC